MKKEKRSFLLIWILALALLLNVLAFVPVVAEGPRDLATVGDFDYTITYKARVKEGTETKEIEIDDDTVIPAEGFQSLNVDVNFNIANNFVLLMGDYFQIDLSGLSKIVDLPALTGGRIVFEIKDEVGGEVESINAASYIVTPGPLLKVEFDQNLEELNAKYDRLGFVGLLFTAEDNGEQLLETIVVPVSKTQTKTFFVKRAAEGTSAISKKAEEYIEGSGTIVWIIDVNTVLDNITGAYIVDSLPEGHNVLSVQLVNLKETGGSFSEEGDRELPMEGNGGYTIDEEGDQLMLTVPLGDLKYKAKRIIITTKFEDGKGSSEHENTARLFDKDKKQVGENATASIVAGITGLSKTSASIEGSNEIVWEIKYIGDGETKEITDTLTLTSSNDKDLKYISLFFDKYSVKVNGAEFPSANGGSESVTVTSKEGELEIKISGLPNVDGTPYTITYSTHSFFSGIGTKNYTVSNNAEYGTYGKAESNESFSKNAVIEKEFAKVRQEEMAGKLHTYIDWTITINRNSEVWKNVVIEETVPDGFKFIEAKWDNDILATSLDSGEENGDPEVIEIIVVSGSKTLDGPATITVTTELTDPNIEPDTNGIIGYNEARVKWNLAGDGYGEGNGIGDGLDFGEDIGSGYSETFRAPITKENLEHKLTKTAVSKSIDQSGKTGKASWKLDYKTYTSSIPFDLVIKDSIDTSEDLHTYDPSLFKLVINGSVEIGLSANTEMITWLDTQDPSKFFSYKLVINDDSNTFTLTIVPGASDTSTPSDLFNDDANHIVLTYDTIVDFTKLNDVEPDQQNTLKNDVSVTAGILDPLYASANQSFTVPFSHNGVKSVKKDNNDRTYTWTAKLNYKSKTISKDKTIKDTLSKGQVYVASTLKIYKAELTNNYDLKKVTVDGNEVLLGDDDYTVSFTPEGDNPTKMEITFTKDLDHPIIIEYQTKAVGIAEKRYNNSLSYYDMTYSSSVTRNNHDKFIEKELLNGRGTNGNLVVLGDVLDWKIDVNKSLSEIHNFVLTDTPSEGLILLPDSIKVFTKSNDNDVDVTNQFTKTIPDHGFTLSKALVD
ncbi:MAG: hypothetical protein GXY57_02860, partial [Erysipelotrichaceae bacterium]|nr:hypothetical protein [Erysipelotrichaceae bacterium]